MGPEQQQLSCSGACSTHTSASQQPVRPTASKPSEAAALRHRPRDPQTQWQPKHTSNAVGPGLRTGFLSHAASPSAPRKRPWKQQPIVIYPRSVKDKCSECSLSSNQHYAVSSPLQNKHRAPPRPGYLLCHEGPSQVMT